MVTATSEKLAAEYLTGLGKKNFQMTEKEHKKYWSILHGGDRGEKHGRRIADAQLRNEGTRDADLSMFTEKTIDTMAAESEAGL